MAIGVAAIVLSAAIAVFVVVNASAPVRFFGASLPFVEADWWWLSLLGYLLTPVVVIICYGWDAIGQRDGLRRPGSNFVLRRQYSTVLLWAAGASVVLGGWHVLNLSVPLTEAWGLS